MIQPTRETVERWVEEFQDWCLSAEPKHVKPQSLAAFAKYAAEVDAYLRQIERVKEAYEHGQKIGIGGGGRRHEPYHRGRRCMAWLAGWEIGNFRYCTRLPEELRPAIQQSDFLRARPWDEKPWYLQPAHSRIINQKKRASK